MKHRPYLSHTHALLSTTDWSRTPLGEPDRWPVSLRGYVSMVMAMTTPAIIFWGPELTQIYNDGYAQIMGPRHPRYFGAPYRECWPDTYPLIYPWMRRVLDDGEVVEVDKERIPLTRFGFEEDAYFTFTFTPLRDDEGRIAGILQPVFEVTETVLAERRATLLRSLATLGADDALWDSAMQELARASDDIPQAQVWAAEGDGAVAIAATPGVAASGAGHERDRALALQALRNNETAWGEQPRTLAVPIEAAPGAGAQLALLLRPSPRLQESAAYLEFLHMVGVEVSSAYQRAQAADAQERQRAFLHRLFLQAPAGIAVLRGPQHVFELSNPMYQSLIGHRDVIGKPIAQAMPELQVQPFVDILDRVYRSGTPYVGFAEPSLVARSPGSAPEQAFFNFVYQPLQDEHQRTEGILVFCYEVTQQVLARQHVERLAQALRQEHTRKDEFLAMLAHELRNPLAPIRSAADLLARAPGQESVVLRASGIIGRQVQHLAALVDDLLDVSRVTRGLVDLERSVQDLRAVLLQAAEQARPLIESRSHRLVLELPQQSLYVEGDHKRLVQVFTNLLNNAAKYTLDGGVVTLRTEARGDRVCVAVEDNGLGIEPELLPRMFDLFVQGARGSARAEGGLGIGLALVRSLVQMHGGTVTAASPGLGQGSRFEVVLPLARAGSDAVPQDAQQRAPAAGAGQRVLVIDDNADAAQMLALQAQHAGYEVDVVYNGRDALDACARRQYIACLVDIGLPDLAGTEVAARVRATASGEVPLLVAVSGYGQEADRRVAHEAGFDHYLVKPVDFLPLSQLLHERAVRADGLA